MARHRPDHEVQRNAGVGDGFVDVLDVRVLRHPDDHDVVTGNCIAHLANGICMKLRYFAESRGKAPRDSLAFFAMPLPVFIGILSARGHRPGPEALGPSCSPRRHVQCPNVSLGGDGTY